MVQRSIPFLLLAGIVSCSGDPTGDLSDGVDHLSATPTQLFVGEGTTAAVEVTARDAAGNSVESSFSFSNVGAGIEVERDTTFEPIRNANGVLVPNPRPNRVKYLVTAIDPTSVSAFTANAGGESVVITVRNLPDTATSLPDIAFSNIAPANGTTVSVTVPAPFRFSAASVITFDSLPLPKPTLLTGAKVSYSADSTTLTFLAPPGFAVGRAAKVSGIVLDYAPTAATYTRKTTNALTTPALPRVTLTPAAAAAGDTITLTVPAPFTFTPNPGGSVVTGFGNAVVSVSGDGRTLKLLAGPSANDTATVTLVHYEGAPSFGDITLRSDTKLVTAAVPNYTSVFSAASPGINDTVTVTTTTGFRFLPTSTLSIGTAGVLIVSRSADSSSIRFVAPPGAAAGAVTANGVVLSFLRTVPLTLPSSTTITPAAGLAGAGAIGTAPTIVIPAAGGHVTLADGGAFAASGPCNATGVNCRFYKFTLAGTRTFKLTLNWGNTADLGGYIVDATGADLIGDFACDSKGSGAAGQPESCTQTLTAGTYFISLANFSATPPPSVFITLDGL